MKSICLALIASAILLPSGVHGQSVHDFESPDGRLTARIIDVKKSPSGTAESVVSVIEGDKSIVSESYTSEDGEHGFGVYKQAWTPDSQFFVFSTQSSGGHQAWHSPTFFISAKDRKVRSLDHYLGLVTVSEFTVIAPDSVQATVRPIADLENERWATISLGKAIEEEQ